MSEEIEEPIEKPQKAPTEESHSGPTEVPQSELSKKEYVCSVCSATVVPEEHETSRGIRYRCPECGKFMKPLTPEDVKEKEEEARGPLLPDDIAMTERVKHLLSEELSTVYGIPEKQRSGTIRAILDTITQDTVRDPLILHNHIKYFAKNANDRHLEAVIAKIYSRLSEEGYLSREDDYAPLYSSIRRGRGKMTKRYSSLRRGLGIRDEEAEEYEVEEYRGKRSQRMKIVVDGQEVDTDFDGYMAWKRWQQESGAEERRREEHQLRMKRLEAEITKIYSDTQGGTNLGDDGLRRQLDDEREKRHQADQQRLGDHIQRLSEEVKKQPTFMEQLDYFKQAGLNLGMKTTGRTTLDLLSEGIDKVDNRAAQLLQRMPGPSSEFKPQVTRTANERKEKAQQIMTGLDKTEEILEVENALIEAASKVKSSD